MRVSTLPLVAVAFLLVGTASPAQDAQTWIGTWKLDTARSKCEGTPDSKSQTIVATDASGATHYVIDVQEADGSTLHMDFVAGPDGKSAPISGAPDYADAITVTEPKPGHRHLVLSKGGMRVEWDSIVMSKDGKHLYSRLAGTDAGKSWKCHWVSVRQ
jgi:hypothetical protein